MNVDTQGKTIVFCTPYKVKKYVFFNIRLCGIMLLQSNEGNRPTD